MKKTTALFIVLSGLILVPTLAQAVCSECYWAMYFVGKGNDYATTGISQDNGCPPPWSMPPDYSCSITLGLALDDGEDAESLLWSAYQTCNAADAQDALDAAIAARDHAYSVCYGTKCLQQCPDNPCCTYACSAYTWYRDGVDGAEDCVYQTCPGTAAKWQSDYYDQDPYLSPGQPNPPVCLTTDRCLYSTGSSAAHGTIISDHWLCSAESIDGRSQGVWYLCESTREAAGVSMEGRECVLSGGSYIWQ